jgi:hypothetical protein
MQSVLSMLFENEAFDVESMFYAGMNTQDKVDFEMEVVSQ